MNARRAHTGTLDQATADVRKSGPAAAIHFS
jgi:hypothetical protein